MRILLVDDNKDLIDGLQQILEQDGYAVDCCYDANSALKQIIIYNYDILFIDGKLPDGNGFDVYNEYLRLKKRGKVIIMTAYRTEQLIDYLLSPDEVSIIHQPEAIAMDTEETDSFARIIITNNRTALLDQLPDPGGYNYILLNDNAETIENTDINHVIIDTQSDVMGKILTMYRLYKTDKLKKFTLLIDNKLSKLPLKEFSSCGCLLKPFEPDTMFEIITKIEATASNLESSV